MNIYVYIAKLNRVKWYVHRSIGARRKEVLWREMNKNIESGEESVCSRASYNYSTLVTIQCLLKVRDFVARFLRATSKMASSAGLFACWPVLHSRKDFLSLESNLALVASELLRNDLQSPSTGFGLLNNAPPSPSLPSPVEIGLLKIT